MNQSREAHHPARPLHSPEGGRQLLIAGQVAGMSWPYRCP